MEDAAKLQDLIRFYAILGRLEQGVGGARRLSSSDGRMDWPTRGVHSFFEPGDSPPLRARQVPVEQHDGATSPIEPSGPDLLPIPGLLRQTVASHGCSVRGRPGGR